MNGASGESSRKPLFYEGDVMKDSFEYAYCFDFKRTTAMITGFHDIWLS